jgi:putative tricarboxylic transport membrane protein
MRDLLVAGAFALLAVVVWLLTAPFPAGAEGSLSPAFYPRLLAGSIVLLAGLLAAQGVRRWNDRPAPESTAAVAGDVAAPGVAVPDVAAAAVAVGLTALYLVAWHRWRFDIPTVLYVTALSRLSGGRRWGSALLFGALVTAFLFLAFGYVLRVPLDGI